MACPLTSHLTQPTEAIALLLLSSQTTKGSRVEVSQVSPEEALQGPSVMTINATMPELSSGCSLWRFFVLLLSKWLFLCCQFLNVFFILGLPCLGQALSVIKLGSSYSFHSPDPTGFFSMWSVFCIKALKLTWLQRSGKVDKWVK